MLAADKTGVDDFIADGGTWEQLLEACRPAEEVLNEWAEGAPQYGFTHWGSAQRLADSIGEDFRWCPKVKWHGWREDRGVWVRPAEHILMDRAVKALEAQAKREVRAMQDMGSDEQRKAAIKYLFEVQTVGGVEGAIKFLRGPLEGSWDKFDTNPDRLSLKNGTLVFDGPEVNFYPEHFRDDYITKQSPVEYDETVDCPFWRQTLEMFVPNERIRAFLQRLAGSLLVAGGMRENKIPFFYGNGGCGKSTFSQGMGTILGEDLAVPIDPATIRTAQRSGSSASPDLFALLGSRIVIAEEAEDPDGGKSQSIDVGMIKRWSGGTDSTKIVARPMYGDVVKFLPTFTLVLIANNAPDFKDPTEGIWRRLLVIPFNTPVPEGVKPLKSDEVARRFRAEAAGILNWALEGYRQWQTEGLNPPPEVLLAGKELRKEQDHLGNFLSECVHDDPNGFVSSEDLHKAWVDWRGGDKEIPDLSQRKLTTELKTHKGWGRAEPKKIDGKTVRGWEGISLGAAEVTHLPQVTQRGEEMCNRETAGQRPVDLEVTQVTQDSVRVSYARARNESSVSEGSSEKLCNPGSEAQKQPLTCADAVTQLPPEMCNRPTFVGLVPTMDFSTGKPSEDDAPWRSLYRSKQVR